jgi:hypothetical protein
LRELKEIVRLILYLLILIYSLMMVVLKSTFILVMIGCIRKISKNGIKISLTPLKTPRGRFELPRRKAPVAFEATAFPD